MIGRWIKNHIVWLTGTIVLISLYFWVDRYNNFLLTFSVLMLALVGGWSRSIYAKPTHLKLEVATIIMLLVIGTFALYVQNEDLLFSVFVGISFGAILSSTKKT